MFTHMFAFHQDRDYHIDHSIIELFDAALG